MPTAVQLVITVLGGLALFIYGMGLMSDGLTQIAGARMKSILGYVTKNRVAAIAAGTGVTALKISPFCSEEVFFEAKNHVAPDDVYDRNRAQVGLSFKPMPETLPGLGCNLYYMVQHDWFDSSHWTPTNIYGLEVKYSF